MSDDFIPQLVADLDKHIAELESELDQVRQCRAELVGPIATAKRSRGPNLTTAQIEQKVLKELKNVKEDGESVKQLAEKISANRKSVDRVVKELVNRGVLTKVREEKTQGVHPRPFYHLNKEAL